MVVQSILPASQWLSPSMNPRLPSLLPLLSPAIYSPPSSQEDLVNCPQTAQIPVPGSAALSWCLALCLVLHQYLPRERLDKRTNELQRSPMLRSAAVSNKIKQGSSAPWELSFNAPRTAWDTLAADNEHTTSLRCFCGLCMTSISSVCVCRSGQGKVYTSTPREDSTLRCRQELVDFLLVLTSSHCVHSLHRTRSCMANRYQELMPGISLNAWMHQLI